MQTRFHSFIEVVTTTVIKYVIALINQAIIFPLFGIYTSLAQNMAIAGYFTITSIIIGYVMRRKFNNIGSDLDDFLARIIVKLGFGEGGIVPGATEVDPHDPEHWMEIGNVESIEINGVDQGEGKGKLYIARK